MQLEMSEKTFVRLLRSLHVSGRVGRALEREAELFKESVSGKHVKELLWVVSGQFFSLLLGLASIKITTKIGPTEYGKYALIGTLSALLAALLYGAAEQGMLRFYYDFERRGAQRTFLNTYYAFLFSSACIVLFTCLSFFLIGWPHRNGSIQGIVLAGGIYVVAMTVSGNLSSLINLLRKRKASALFQTLEKMLVVAFLAFLYFRAKLTLTAILYGVGGVYILIIACKLIFIRRSVPLGHGHLRGERSAIRKEILRTVSQYSKPFAIWGGAGWLQFNGERWVIEKMLTTADVGIYSVMMALVNFLIVLPYGVLARFAEPIVYGKFADLRSSEDTKKGMTYIRWFVAAVSLLGIFGVLVTTFIGRDLVLVISSGDYASHWRLLPLMTGGVGLFYVGQSLALVGMARNVPKKYLFPKVSIGLTALVMYLSFCRWLELTGIAISLSLVGLIYLLMIIWTNRPLWAQGELRRG